MSETNNVRAALPRATRRDAIRRVIRNRAVATQEELGRLLSAEGFAVTQATLSRDLAQLGAMRVSLPSGGTVYSLDPSPPPSEHLQLEALAPQVVRIQDNGNLVVLHTHPGMASAVAVALDRARLPEALGSIAGDDTIFAAPSRGTTARQLARRLEALFGLGETT